MQWMGELVGGCPAERNWKLLRLIAGSLNGVKFSLHRGKFYTDVLSTEEIESLLGHPWVLLSIALGEGEPAVQPSEDTPEEPRPFPLARRGRPRR